MSVPGVLLFISIGFITFLLRFLLALSREGRPFPRLSFISREKNTVELPTLPRSGFSGDRKSHTVSGGRRNPAYRLRLHL